MSFDFDSFVRVIKPLSPTAPPLVQFLKERLTASIQAADPDVRRVFFPAAPGISGAPGREPIEGDLRALAVKYAAFLVSTVPEQGFGETINNAMAAVNTWFDQGSHRVGEHLFVDYLRQPGVLSEAFASPAEAATTIAERAGTETFLTGLLAEESVSGKGDAARALLVALRALDADGKQLASLLAKWQQSGNWSRIAGWDELRWLDQTKSHFAQNAAGYEPLKSAVRAACLKQQVERSERNAGFVQVSSGQVSSAKVTVTTTTYGAEVVQWLDSNQGPRQHGLRSEKGPDNVVVDDGGSGCVLPGTPILLADGTWRPIRDLREGDRVAAAGGRASVLSSERVVNRNVTHLWSINDDEPFMSLEHAIMTQRGWCCLAPDIAREIDPQVHVKTLAVGDVVWKTKGLKDGAVSYEMVEVTRINIRRARPGERIVGHDLHFSEGHASYHAGGYLNLLNYPEITTQRIASGMLAKLSPSEREAFRQQFQALAPLLQKTLGAPVMAAVQAAVQDPDAHARPHVGAVRRPGQPAADKLVPKMRATPTVGGGPLGFDTLALINGVLFVDGEPVETHCEAHHVYWTRAGPDGTAEHGAIRLARHGLFGDGVVVRGDRSQTFRATATISFTTSVQDGDTAVPWFEFSYGLGEDGAPVGKLAAPGDAKKTARLAKAATIAFSTDEHDQLKVSIVFKTTFCRFGGSRYITAELIFNGDYSGLSGTAVAYDPANRDGNTGKSYPLTGREKTDTASLRQRSSKLMQQQPARIGLIDAEAGLATLSAGLKTARQLTSNILNTPDDLFALPEPEPTLLHETVFSKMKSLMLFGIDDTWRGWFGERKPDAGPGQTLSDSDVAALKETSIKSFLVDTFAVGYLAEAFSSSEEPNIKAMYDDVPDWSSKLAYFWKGTERDKCFGAYQAYGDLSIRMLASCYGDQVSGLNRYLDDHPAKWARELYEHCIRPDTLVGLQVSYATGSPRRLKHLTTMLQTLDPSPQVGGPDGKKTSYARSLYCKVISADVQYAARNVTLGCADPDFLKAFLTEFLTQYFSSLLNNDARWIQSIRDAAGQEFTKGQIHNATELTKNIASLVADFVELAVSNKNNPISVLLRDLIATKYPKLPGYLGRGLLFASYGAGMALAFISFSNWKQLNDLQKMGVVTGTLSMIMGIFSEMAAGKAGRDAAAAAEAWQRVEDALNPEFADDEAGEFFESFESSSEESASYLVLEEEVGSEEEAFADFEIVEDRFLARGGVEASRTVSEAIDFEASAAKWERISMMAGKAARALNVLAMGAAAGAGIYQVIQDFAGNAPLQDKVLDILQTISASIAFVLETITTAAEIFAVEISGAIPVIGIIAVAIGVILMIIQMILGRSPPPSPVEVFVRDHAIPFIKKLTAPPPGWGAPKSKPALAPAT